MNILILSCSLNPKSHSRVLAKTLSDTFQTNDIPHELLDLQTLSLPLCDGSSTYAHPDIQHLTQKIADATGIVFALPIYNYGFNSAAKTVIEHAGKAMTEIPIGFLASAGGQGSYMSLMSLANALMLDFRCPILPRFVYATGQDFDENNHLISDKIIDRLQQFGTHFPDFVRRLSH